jgi:hypothetical protein
VGGTSSGGNCTGGALYACDNKTATNNCTLLQACTSGCLVTDSPQGKLTEACNTTALKPLTVTPQNPLGGQELTVIAQLANPHPNGMLLNLLSTRSDLLQGIFCAPNLPAGVSSETFKLATPVVGTPTPAVLTADFNWVDATGSGFELSIVPEQITLGPGGTLPPPPPIQSMQLVPTSLDPGGIGFMYVTLADIAPAGGTSINVTSSDPAVASIIAGGQPFIGGGCVGSTGTETIQIASSVPKAETVTMTASSGAAGQAPFTAPLQVAAGCVPHGCSGGPSCGAQSDGCGGTLTNCGCFNSGFEGETCGADNLCHDVPVFGVKTLTLNPSTVSGGRSSVATVTTNMPAPAGGGVVAIFADNALVKVPPSFSIPAGATSATFTLTTGTLTSGTVTSTIDVDDSLAASAVLTITPTVSCTPQSCAQQGKSCGTISDGCGGTLTCGACTGTQSCGGGGVANVCGGSSSTGTLSVTATGGGGDITTTPTSAIKASSGHPSSGTFDIGTTITLKTSDGHGAVWSGACSSAGATTGTCTFIFNASGSVTAANK